MIHMVGLTFSLRGYVRPDEDTKSFVVYCPSLDIYTAAQTRDEVEPTMISAATLFFRLCYDRGILEQVLQKRGFIASQASASEEQAMPRHGAADFIVVEEKLDDFNESFPFNVPMPLISNQLTGVAS